MPERAHFSVVVCAHADRRFDTLLDAVGSVQRQSVVPFEVIVVIDHNDRLLERVRAALEGVEVSENRHAAGLSGARNTGIDLARGDCVAFIDDDALASPHWLERLGAAYTDRRVIGAGGRVDPYFSKGRPRWFPQEFDWVIGCTYRGHPNELTTLRNLIGCNMSFRTEVLRRSGGFDENLGRSGGDAAGCEETELCIRASRLFPDTRIVYDPSALVQHRIEPNRLTWTYFRSRCVAEGRSKALVVHRQGRQAGLASERTYVRKTLPLGVLRNLGDVILKADVAGLARAAAIGGGLSLVAASYLGAKIGRGKEAPQDQVGGFAPYQILDVDLSAPLPDVEAVDPQTGTVFGGAFCLVRQRGRPVGIVEFPIYGRTVGKAELAELLAPPANVVRSSFLPPPASASPLVRVVVATHDRPQPLATCLDKLLAQDYPNYEIVVVDNAPSSSETRDMIASRFGTVGKIHYVVEMRAGLGHAHNAGLAGATAPIVAFTDDDVEVDPRWLSAIVSNFARSDRVGCVTGLILPAELDTKAQLWTERHGGFGKGFDRRVYDMGENRPHNVLFPFAAGALGSGANMAYRTETLRKIGGFDDALGAGTLAKGGDDLAGFAATLLHGYQLVYDPEAIVWHHHRRTEEGTRGQAYGYGVGLGAYLTKMVLDRPATLWHFLMATPWAIAHLLRKGQGLPSDYPRSWQRREWIGVAVGVPAYLRSRASFRRHRRRNEIGRILSAGRS